VIEMARISGALDPMVQLYDPKGVLIAASEASEIDTPRARIENYQLTMSGIYTIVASDGSWNVDTGEYGLSLMIAPGDAASLCECIVSSETKLGNIEFAGKMHCYPFCGEVGHGVV